MESEGGHRARAGGSFDYAQDDETGAAMESAGMLGLVRISGRWSGLWEVRSEEWWCAASNGKAARVLEMVRRVWRMSH